MFSGTETDRPKTAAFGGTICSCSLVSLLRLELGLSLGLAFENRFSEDVLIDYSFVQGVIHRVLCGPELTGMINFHKRLDL